MSLSPDKLFRLIDDINAEIIDGSDILHNTTVYATQKEGNLCKFPSFSLF